MALRSTFYAFTTASRALALNQKSLDVVGQNISNMGTDGYTRQRVDRYSVTYASGNMYAGKGDSTVGQGAEASRISQSRDPFLDVRFRMEAPNIGGVDSVLTVLKDLENVFDETTMDGITAQMSDMLKHLQTLSTKAGNAEFEGVVKTSAELLTKLFNQFSGKIQSTKAEQEFNLTDVEIPKINDILKGIDKLNSSIKKEHILGGSALELLDQRNALIDELSLYTKIDVKTKQVAISPGVSYEELSINFVDDQGVGFEVLNANGYGELTAQKDAVTGKYEVMINIKGVPTDISSHMSKGSIRGYLDMLNKSGEFDGGGETVRGIGYYENMLDVLANKFATELNALNARVANPKYDPADPSKGPQHFGGPLFETKDGSAKITAGNIKISKGWADNDYGIVAGTPDELAMPGNTEAANGNIMKMISLFSSKLSFTGTNAQGNNLNLFTGTFQEMLAQTGTTLALEVKSNETNLKNYMSVLENVQALRDSVSAVSLDEEGVSLLQYQKSYNAAARLMTTLDEALDTIINNMGVVGR